jgi:predicted RNase H-like HicB family nuclease
MPVSSDLPDTAIKVYANNWVATIFADMRPNADGYFHVYCSTVGATQDDARAGAQAVLEAFASGREAFIRERPAAQSATNHVTSETCHTGLTRFSYKLEPGMWSYPNETLPKSFGEQH